MAPYYSKNCILKGTVDFYCLVCEAYLKSETDHIDHIAKPIHKKNLDSTQYVNNFEEDSIRKVKKGYFCELCNKLFPMMARVKIHVKETSHMENKKMTYFKRNGVNVIAFGKVVLDERAWNGLNDESCAFCNTEYDDEQIHKNLLSHILNIIQMKVEVDENKNIYRKIDDVSFQCLTCNMVLALDNITCHFEEDQHKDRYQECCSKLLNKINRTESHAPDLKNIEVNKTIEGKTIDCLGVPLKETGVTEQASTATHSDVNAKCDALEEVTASGAIPSNEVDDNEKEFKSALSTPVKQELKDPKDDSLLKKTDETKEEPKAVKDSNVNKPNINKADKKVKKNKTKLNSESNDTKKSETSNKTGNTGSKSRFNIEEYEKKICKILKTEDYITLDENGKTLCILCDWIMDPMNKDIHVNGLHHHTMEKMHKRRLAQMVANNTKESTGSQNKNVLDLVSKFQSNNVNINLISNTAVCKKCTLDLPFHVSAIEEHILQHNQLETSEPKNKVSESCDAIDKGTCKNTSDVTIEENNEGNEVKNANENDSVEGKNVADKPTSKEEEVKVEEEVIIDKNPSKDEAENSLVTETVLKQSLCYYINILTGIKYMLFKDVMINDNICISLTSFHYLMPIKGETMCLICNEEVRDIEAHINILQHIRLVNNIPIILNKKSEFVREVRPGLFHCGFCNITVPTWSEMQEHFTSSLHKEIRNASEWRMEMYLHQIRNDNYYTMPAGFSVFSMRNMLSRLL